jgi:hypothetical protein
MEASQEDEIKNESLTGLNDMKDSNGHDDLIKPSEPTIIKITDNELTEELESNFKEASEEAESNDSTFLTIHFS